MANPLTGDYEAVLQVSVRQINGILAALHQARMDPKASPSFPHSVSIRIGDPPPGSVYELKKFQEWIASGIPGLKGTVGEMRAAMSGYAPAGVMSLFQQAWHDLDLSVELPGHGRPRGRADIQLAAPRITVVPGARNEVTVHVWVRARFSPDPGARDLPSPIHGEVLALYRATRRVVSGGRVVLRVSVSTNDNDVRFQAAPGTGLNTTQQDVISGYVRTALRSTFAALDVNLPLSFTMSDFTALGTGLSQTLVLPLQLSGGPPVGNLATVTSDFLGGSDFAFAVSRQFIQGFIDTLIDSVKASAAAVDITLSGPLGTTHYTPSVSISPVVWKNGSIEISGKIDLTTPAVWAPNGEITFKQGLLVTLDVTSGNVALVPAGDPSVDESFFISHDTAFKAVKSARDGALPPASASLNANFKGALAQLDSGVKSFDAKAAAAYTAIEVTPDGIVARGEISTPNRLAPVVHSKTTDFGTAFTAFQSWIPGGRITRFKWNWVEKSPGVVWSAQNKSVALQHVFTLDKPPQLQDVTSLCLRIEGTRLNADGYEEAVVSRQSCAFSLYDPLLLQPDWWMKLILAKFQPNPPGGARLSEEVSAHVSAVGKRRRGTVTTNVLVHLAGERMERPLNALADALSHSRTDTSLIVILGLPRGAFDVSRAELEERLGEVDEGFRPHLEITEDYAGGWSRTFASHGPATYFINARGELVWTDEGRLDPHAVARAIAEHTVDAPPPQLTPARLSVEAGAEPHDVLFTDECGNHYSLRRRRRQRVLITFWQSWSSPCLRELRRLQTLHEQRDGPFVLAVNGGEDRDVLMEVRQRERLDFPLIHDPHQAIVSLYDVRCWPTTISINEDGIVDGVQFGAAHDHDDDDEPDHQEPPTTA